MSVERSGYPAFPTYPATAGTVSPWRPIDATTQRVRVTLSGTFTVQVEISNAQARNVPEHLFLPLDSDAEIYDTTSSADLPVDIRAPVRWVRLRVLSGSVTGGNVDQTSLSAPAASVDDVDDLRVIAEDASTRSMTAEGKADDAKNAIGNLNLTTLNGKAQSEGPQLVDGSRWTWQASGTPNGGTIVSASGGGVWVREVSGPVKWAWFNPSSTPLANNTSKFMAAQQAALDSGATLLLPPGQFDLFPPDASNKIQVLSGVHIKSEAGNTTLRVVRTDTTGANPRLYLTGVSNVLDGIKVTEIRQDGQPLIRNGLNAPITLEGASFVTLRNVEVDGSSGTALHILTSQYVNVFGGRWHNTMADGIHVSFGAHHVNITGAHIYDNDDDCIGLVSHGYGLPGIGLVRQVTVTGCVLGQTRTGAGYNGIGSGVAVVGAVDVTITGNTVYKSGTAGMRVLGLREMNAPGNLFSAAARVVMSDNVITDCGYSTFPGIVYDGIYLGDCRDVRVSNNVITRPKRAGIKLAGVFVNVAIEDNSITGGTEAGVFVGPLKDSTAYVRQLWTDAEYGDGTPDPGYVTGHDLSIRGNMIRRSGLAGVQVECDATNPIQRMVVADNTVADGNTQVQGGVFGIMLPAAAGGVLGRCRVSGNTVSGNFAGAYRVPLDVDFDGTNLPSTEAMFVPVGVMRLSSASAKPANGFGFAGDLVLNSTGGTVLGWRKRPDNSTWDTLSVTVT